MPVSGRAPPYRTSRSHVMEGLKLYKLSLIVEANPPTTSSLRGMLALFATLVTLFSISYASPIDRRDVWVPQVLYPREGIVWKVGFRHNVTWDTSSQPAQITNPVGRIQLRKDNSTLPGDLADGFQLSDGRHEITVPDVTPGCGYQIVLFGDSGNFSPEFIIAAEGD